MSNKKSAPNKSVDEIVTDKVIALIEEKQELVWQKCWQCAGISPKNFVSKKPYRGINYFLATMFAPDSEYFMTFNQINDQNKNEKAQKGIELVKPLYKERKQLDKTTPEYEALTARIIKIKDEYNVAYLVEGSSGLPIVYANKRYYKIVDGKRKTVKTEEESDGYWYMTRYSNVFSQHDIMNVDFPKTEVVEMTEKQKNAKCEATIKALQEFKGLKLQFGGDVASYSPSLDRVQMPEMKHFESSEAYYGVMFHELIHWTGHNTRLDRFEATGTQFGSKSYSKEELVAELGSGILAAEHQISTEALQENSAAYLKNWL